MEIAWIEIESNGFYLKLMDGAFVSLVPPPFSVWSIAFLDARACGFFPPGVLCECFLFPVFAFPYRFFNSWAPYPVRESPIGLNLSVFGRTTVSCSISFGDLGDRGGIQGGEGLQVYHLDLSRFVFFLHISLVSGCVCVCVCVAFFWCVELEEVILRFRWFFCIFSIWFCELSSSFYWQGFLLDRQIISPLGDGCFLEGRNRVEHRWSAPDFQGVVARSFEERDCSEIRLVLGDPLILCLRVRRETNSQSC